MYSYTLSRVKILNRALQTVKILKKRLQTVDQFAVASTDDLRLHKEFYIAVERLLTEENKLKATEAEDYRLKTTDCHQSINQD